MIPSSGGVFEVMVGGTLVFSKKASGRFPATDEALDLLEPHKDDS